MSTYRVKRFEKDVNISVKVPGSKSVTNRALLLAAISDGVCVLEGAGMSDDSKVFLDALVALGFDVRLGGTEDERTSLRAKDNDFADEDAVDGNTIVIHGTGGTIPKKNAKIYVGSAGTAARFLTAMVGLSDGCYEVTSSEQMKVRPMKPLLLALEELGARFEFLEEEYRFPFKVYGRYYDQKHKSEKKCVSLNIDESSQFLSALLLCGSMVREGFDIRLTGKRQARSYVEITEKMMREFGYGSSTEGKLKESDYIQYNSKRKILDDEGSTESLIRIEDDVYRILPEMKYSSREYFIEPDVSAACYFYAMSAVNGESAVVKGVHEGNSQGDMKFLDLLKSMGCDVSETKEGIRVSRESGRALHGVDINMSDFSDQTMTLAAIAPFADSPTTIKGVEHIRRQESDRIHGIVTELSRLGIRCEEYDDGMKIYPVGEDFTLDRDVLIETYDDHRMAMAFAVLGTRLDGVVIDNPECCRKTFEDFFYVLDKLSN